MTIIRRTQGHATAQPLADSHIELAAAGRRSLSVRYRRSTLAVRGANAGASNLSRVTACRVEILGGVAGESDLWSRWLLDRRDAGDAAQRGGTPNTS